MKEQTFFSRFWRPLVLLLLVFASYSGVISEATWIWDDNDYVTQNPVLREAGGLADIWLEPSATPQYYPLVHTSFWIESRLYGVTRETPVDAIPTSGFHFVNVLLHAITALLFWRFLFRLGVPGAFFAAMLFAVHPISVESVAWVTERKNVLSALFAVASAIAWLRWTNGYKKHTSLALCIFFFVCGLLSKTVIASLPAAFFLILLWQWPNQWKRQLPLLIGMMALGAYSGWHTAMMEVQQVGATGAAWDWSIGQRFLLAGKVLWVYLAHVLWPADLMFFYPKWGLDTSHLISWLWPITAALLPFVAWGARKRFDYGPVVAILIFGGVLFPVLGFLNVYPMKFSFVADHFQYHANFAIFALLGAILCRLVIRLGWSNKTRNTVASVLFVALGMLTYEQGKLYTNEETLWRTTIQQNPQSWISYHNLGVLLRKQNQFDQAEEMYNQGLAIERDPKLVQSWAELQLAKSDAKGGDLRLLQLAEAAFAEAVKKWPDYFYAHVGLGHVAIRPQNRNLRKAVKHYEDALRLLADSEKSDLSDAQRANLQSSEAATAARANLAKAHHDFGRQAASSGDASQAVEHFKQALHWRPDYIPAEVDRLWIRLSHQDSSVRREGAAKRVMWLYEQMKAGPAQAEVLDLVAAAFAAQGDFQQAISVSTNAIKLAQQQGNAKLARDIQSRQQGYKNRLPFLSKTGLP